MLSLIFILLLLSRINAITPSASKCVVFFTGGSGIIQPYLYRNFLHNIQKNNVDICVPHFRENITKIVEKIKEDYTEITYVAHSSGATVALNNCIDPIQKLILLDPVNTRLDDSKFKIETIRYLLFINAYKSFHTTYEPYGLPFIPFLRITRHQLDPSSNCVIKTIESSKHGHCDILNQPFSDMMHYSRIAVGVKERDITQYQEWLADEIIRFIKI